MARFKSNFLRFASACAASPMRLAARAVLGAAFCAFLASCVMYWHGKKEAAENTAAMQPGGRPLSQAAQSEGIRISAEVLAAVLSKEAESVSGGEREVDSALSAALSSIYPDVADNGYFVLWRDTVDVCSPLTPDTAGLDFGSYRDAAGNMFIQDLKRIAAGGGGFASFILLKAGREHDKSYGLESAIRKKNGPSIKIPYIAYATPIQGTNLHLTLWREAVPSASYNLQAELAGDDNWSILGLCMAGLSFLGVSVLLRGIEK